MNRSRFMVDWARRSWLTCLLGGLSLGALAGCPRTKDLTYCATNDDCAARVSDGGSRLVCATDRHLCVESVCGTNSDCPDRRASRCPELLDSTGTEKVQCQPCDTADPMSCSHIKETRQRFDGTSYDAKLTRCVKGDQGNVCVECTAPTDCPSDRPICDSNSCRPCIDHNDCGGSGPVTCAKGAPCQSYLCISRFESPLLDANQDGRCAVPASDGDIIYVRDSLGSPMNDGLTPDTPKADLPDAVTTALRSNRRYVRLLGGTYALAAPVDLATARTLVVVGAPAKGYSTEPARITSTTGALFSVRSDSRLSIDQADLRQGKADTAVVTCDNAYLSLRGSRLRGVTPKVTNVPYTSAAVDITSGCDAIIQRNQIGIESSSDALAHNVGVRIAGPGRSYRIDGNIITGNQGSAIDLSLASGLTLLRARFNTIAQNGTSLGLGISGGIFCSANASNVQIRHSIIAGNFGAIALQVGGACLAAAPTDNNFINSAAPMLTPTFRLDPTQATNFRDKTSPTNEELRELLPRDIDNAPRPLGPAWDYGAHELPAP